jgi:hypothetical protein
MDVIEGVPGLAPRVDWRLRVDGLRQLRWAVVGVDDSFDVPAELQPEPQVALARGSAHRREPTAFRLSRDDSFPTGAVAPSLAAHDAASDELRAPSPPVTSLSQCGMSERPVQQLVYRQPSYVVISESTARATRACGPAASHRVHR